MKILSRPRLRDLTSLHLGGDARCMLLPESDDDYGMIPSLAQKYGGRPFFMGRGTNILAEDGPHELVLVRQNCLAEPKMIKKTARRVLVAVDAGMGLARFSAWCIKNGYSGLEPMSGIPGNVGGAIAMNAGSHGQECFGLLEAVRVWTPEGGVRWLEPGDCVAGYRHFSLRGYEGEFAVLGGLFTFQVESSEHVKEQVRSWFMRKKSVQPLGAHTAGCVFKNPMETSAGMLLDQAGFRGRTLGGMRFSPIHANFLENTGKGTSEHAFELIRQAGTTVAEQFGVRLELEVEVLACP